MPRTIAVAGKGGTGKTTFSALIIRHLLKSKKGSVLAIDADPNSNLNEALGLEVKDTIADFIEETKAVGPLPAGMTKNQFIEYKLQGAITETREVDLLVMGNPEGPGCYCYPNDLLRNHMTNLSKGYDYVVIDNEAGLEHLSRRVNQDVDVMFLMSDATARGIRTAARIADLIKGLHIEVKQLYLVVGRAPEGAEQMLKAEIEKVGVKVAGFLPADDNVMKFDLEGKALAALPDDAPVVAAADAVFKQIPLLA